MTEHDKVLREVRGHRALLRLSCILGVCRRVPSCTSICHLKITPTLRLDSHSIPTAYDFVTQRTTQHGVDYRVWPRPGLILSEKPKHGMPSELLAQCCTAQVLTCGGSLLVAPAADLDAALHNDHTCHPIAPQHHAIPNTQFALVSLQQLLRACNASITLCINLASMLNGKLAIFLSVYM